MSFHYTSQIFFPLKIFLLISQIHFMFLFKWEGEYGCNNTDYIFVMSSEQIITEWNGICYNMFETHTHTHKMLQTFVTTHRIGSIEFIYWNSIIWKKRFMGVIKTFIKEVLLSFMVWDFDRKSDRRWVLLESIISPPNKTHQNDWKLMLFQSNWMKRPYFFRNPSRKNRSIWTKKRYKLTYKSAQVDTIIQTIISAQRK